MVTVSTLNCHTRDTKQAIKSSISEVIQGESFAYISAGGHPLQTTIYAVVCHSYPYLCTNFGPLISIFVRTVTIFVTLTPEF